MFYYGLVRIDLLCLISLFEKNYWEKTGGQRKVVEKPNGQKNRWGKDLGGKTQREKTYWEKIIEEKIDEKILEGKKPSPCIFIAFHFSLMKNYIRNIHTVFATQE